MQGVSSLRCNATVTQWLETATLLKLVQLCAVNFQSCCLCNGCFEDRIQVCNLLQSVVVFKVILVYGDSDQSAQSAIEWDQVGYYMQFVCVCHLHAQKLKLTACILSLVDLKQKFKNVSTSSDIVTAGW